MHDPHSKPAGSTYVFSVVMNGEPTGQTDGLEFTDRSAAWQDASMSCVDILREARHKIQPGCNWQMEVADDAGKPIFRFTFSAEEF
jgi:hypothetical protein